MLPDPGGDCSPRAPPYTLRPMAQPKAIVFRVPSQGAGERLDRLVAEHAGGTSRTRVQAWIRGGRVRVDGVAITRASTGLEAGQEVRIESEPEPADSPFQGLEPALLHEDAELLAVDKPAGLVVHPRAGVKPGNTLAEWARDRFGALPAPHGPERPGVVHRLDAWTSGAMLMARTDGAAETLVEAFRRRRVAKRYLAFVRGEPRFDSEWIDAPIARHPRSPERMSIAPEGEGRRSETYYEVRERFGDVTLLECRPRTGRTHQIRVHLEHAGVPLVADRLYTGGRTSGRRRPEGPWPKRQALHSAGLSLAHPGDGRPFEVEAPLAPDLAAFLEWLRTR